MTLYLEKPTIEDVEERRNIIKKIKKGKEGIIIIEKLEEELEK